METNFNKIHQIADELKYAQNELLKKIAQNIAFYRNAYLTVRHYLASSDVLP